MEFFNYIQFLQVINTYKLLKYAIKYTDIGLLKRIIFRLYLYFAGSLLKNYIYNILLLQRLVKTSAYNIILCRIPICETLSIWLELPRTRLIQLEIVQKHYLSKSQHYVAYGGGGTCINALSPYPKHCTFAGQ